MENFINSWKVDLKEGISDQLSNLMKISLLEYLKGELKEIISRSLSSTLFHCCGIFAIGPGNAAPMAKMPQH